MGKTIGLRPNQYAFLKRLQWARELSESDLRKIDQRITSSCFKRGFFHLTFKLSARITQSGRNTLREYSLGRNINRKDATAPLARVLSTVSTEKREYSKRARGKGKAQAA